MEHTVDSSLLEKIHVSQGLEIKVDDDFSDILKVLNDITGSDMLMRNEGLHLTVVTPVETHVLKTLTKEQIHELQQLSTELSHGKGYHIDGIGIIDGSKRDDVASKYKNNKTSYVAISAPFLQAFRKSLGLAQKDFHITLGIETNDIHGIDKKADPQFAELTPQLVHFGSLYALVSLKPFQKLNI